jgi:uncharacterized coiled-coil protein SlyX
MKWHLTESRGESDHTDELPVLSEEAILEFESRLVAADSAADDPLESSIDALRDALDVAEQRWTALEARLETQDRAIAALQGRVSPPPAFADDAIPILQAVVPEPESVAEDPAPALEDDASAGDELRDGDSHHSLLERIASLETYIAGRADRWQAMEQELNARSRRIAELEIELEQRIEREQRLEDRLHNENDRSNQLRDKLRRMHRRLEELELDSIDHDLEPTRDLVGRAMDTDRVRFRHDQEAPRPDFRRAPRILCLNPDLPDPFVIHKDAITIGRAPDCDIQIATDFVSRRHATIRRDKSSTIIEDRSSTNGVFVNSVRVDRKTLMDGDEFTIGESRFRFVAGEPLPEIHWRRFVE